MDFKKKAEETKAQIKLCESLLDDSHDDCGMLDHIEQALKEAFNEGVEESALKVKKTSYIVNPMFALEIRELKEKL